MSSGRGGSASQARQRQQGKATKLAGQAVNTGDRNALNHCRDSTTTGAELQKGAAENAPVMTARLMIMRLGSTLSSFPLATSAVSETPAQMQHSSSTRFQARSEAFGPRVHSDVDASGCVSATAGQTGTRWHRTSRRTRKQSEARKRQSEAMKTRTSEDEVGLRSRDNRPRFGGRPGQRRGGRDLLELGRAEPGAVCAHKSIVRDAAGRKLIRRKTVGMGGAIAATRSHHAEGTNASQQRSTKNSLCTARSERRLAFGGVEAEHEHRGGRVHDAAVAGRHREAPVREAAAKHKMR